MSSFTSCATAGFQNCQTGNSSNNLNKQWLCDSFVQINKLWAHTVDPLTRCSAKTLGSKSLLAHIWVAFSFPRSVATTRNWASRAASLACRTADKQTIKARRDCMMWKISDPFVFQMERGMYSIYDQRPSLSSPYHCGIKSVTVSGGDELLRGDLHSPRAFLLNYMCRWLSCSI